MPSEKLRENLESGVTGITANIKYQVCSIFGSDWNEGGRSTKVKLDQNWKPERRDSPHAKGKIDADAESLSFS